MVITLKVLPKMVKCALAISHTNAEVERSPSISKRMLTKENIVINEETLIGLRAITAAIKECGVNNIPIMLDIVKAVAK